MNEPQKRILGLPQKFWHELRVLFILVVIAFTIKATLVEVYIVPTGSMENTILTGDLLIGNKFVYGMRTPIWIGLPYTRIGFKVPWLRLPAFQEVENGDVTIFEFPRDPFQKYVKRCIGTPGDVIRSDDRNIYINDSLVVFPVEGKHINDRKIPKDKIQSSLWPYFSGNMDNLGTFVVPYKGMEIDFMKVNDWTSMITILVQDGNTVEFAGKSFTTIDPNEIGRMHGFLKYKVLGFLRSARGKQELNIRAEKERKKFIQELRSENRRNNIYNPWEVSFASADNDLILDNLQFNGVPIREIQSYQLQHDFYFFMGDNRDNSYDSRFWGFVPDSQVLGNPVVSVINIFNLGHLFSKNWDKFLRFKVVS